MENGRRLWRNSKFSDHPASPLSVGGNGVFVCSQIALGAVDLLNGKLLWNKQRGSLKQLPLKRERGLGGSVAVDGELFIQSMSTLRKMDFSGKELWAIRIAPSFNVCATPAVSAGRVVVSSGASIAAYDRKTGDLLWKVNTGKPAADKKKSPEKWYNSSSPLISGNKVVCGTDGGKLLVIDLGSGKILQQLLFESPIKGSAAIGENFICVAEHSGKIHGFFGGGK